ncbi:MAG: multicopper oxidase domain-containing protein, partial [Bacteroidia bacterium]
MQKNLTQLFSFAFLLGVISSQMVNAQNFVNLIQAPPLLLGQNGVFNLTADSSTHNFNPNQQGNYLNTPLKTFCYNQSGYLGPTMVWQRSTPIQINVTNNLNERITTHWHGANLPAYTDGGPQEMIGKGSTWSPSFTVIDHVQTAWYHPHLMDSTTRQVAMGMA